MGNYKDTYATLQLLDKAHLKTLYTSANKLLATPLSVPTQPTAADLLNLLKVAARQQFEKQYNYKYQADQSKPPSVANDATSNINSAEDVCNITDNQSNQILNYVNSILSSIQPGWAQDSARNDLVSAAKGLFKNSAADSWVNLLYPQVYDGENPEENAFRIDAVLLYCNISFKKNNISVPCTLIYYASVYYEVYSSSKVAQNNLLGTSIGQANALLDQPIKISSPQSIEDLKSILFTYGKKLFLNQFGFPYDGDKTQPKDITAGAILHGTDAFCFLPNKQSDLLEPFIDINILNLMLLPYWAKVSARSELLHEVQGLLSSITGNNWTHAPFSKVYNNAIPANDACKTNAIVVYSNASLSNDDVTVEVSFVQYIGVYYGAPSPLIAVKNNLLTKLCSAANQLINPPVPVSSPPTVQDLDNILAQHGLTMFQEEFGFAYQGSQTKPDDISPGTQAQGVNILLYIKGSSPNDLAKLITSEILQKIKFPTSVQDAASDGLLDSAMDLLNIQTGNGWQTNKANELYTDPVDDSADALKTNALLTYSNATLTEGGGTVTISFIYYIGVYYPSASTW